MRVFAVLTLAKDIFLFNASVSGPFKSVYDAGGYMLIF
jgi:regulation of enolase protein 1 (concanavalin A-like superfamily)